jgi:hypothetical protein
MGAVAPGLTCEHIYRACNTAITSNNNRYKPMRDTP